jgi:hypothetical protein
MYIVKVMTERLGKFDPKAFAAAMHGAKFTVKDNPGILLDVTFDQNGDLDLPHQSRQWQAAGGRDDAGDVLAIACTCMHPSGRAVDMADPNQFGRHCAAPSPQRSENF